MWDSQQVKRSYWLIFFLIVLFDSLTPDSCILRKLLSRKRKENEKLFSSWALTFIFPHFDFCNLFWAMERKVNVKERGGKENLSRRIYYKVLIGRNFHLLRNKFLTDYRSWWKTTSEEEEALGEEYDIDTFLSISVLELKNHFWRDQRFLHI